MAAKPKINIPDTGELGYLDKKFEKIDKVLFGVVIVVGVEIIVLLVSVAVIFLDQMKFNNFVYREYIEKQEEENLIIEDYSQQIKLNNELLKQIETEGVKKK